MNKSKNIFKKIMLILLIVVTIASVIGFTINYKDEHNKILYDNNENNQNKINVPKPIKCIYDGDLVSGTSFVKGKYTYKYKQEKDIHGNWKNIDGDGWGVALTNPNSYKSVTDEVCTYINNKPIVSMANMYLHSNAPKIDVSKINTVNVTNMSGMFADTEADLLDLANFDTSSVTDMSYMFADTEAKLDLHNFDTSKVTNMFAMFSEYCKIGNCDSDLDLSSFNTSKVTNMAEMFSNIYSTNGDNDFNILGLNEFNTSKVTDMHRMFADSWLKFLDLSSFDTSNVTNMKCMFCMGAVNEIENINLSSFNTRKVTDMSYMFANIMINDLDLSSFDIRNVIDMECMFDGSEATKGYARTQEDADKFNSVVDEDSNLRFVVK